MKVHQMMFEWVTLKKVSQETGYSIAALRSKIQRGQLHETVHWRKAQDGRVLINVGSFEEYTKQ